MHGRRGLDSNSLTALPSGVFSGLNDLLTLYVAATVVTITTGDAVQTLAAGG